MKDEKLSRVKKYNTEEISTIDIEEEITVIEETEEDTKKEHPILNKILIISIILTISIISYAALIEPNIIITKEYKIENTKLPDTFNGLKIVQFSDIHYGNTINKKQLDKIVDKINNLKPDVILFTGDLISKDLSINDTIKEEITDSLKKLECTLYKYAIYGDEDNETFKEIMDETNFITLNNETKLLYYKSNTPISISGLAPNNNQNYSILNASVDEKEIINLFKIVLVHEPDTIENITRYYPQIVMSGHTMGGLIKLPGLKPLFLPETANNYYEPHYTIDETNLYVSNGLGTSSINARLNNFPSINLYRLYTQK